MKIFYFIISLIIIAAIITIYISFSTLNRKYSTELKEHELLKENYEILESDYARLIEDSKIYDCEYTITLNYIETLDFESQDGNMKYVLFNEFQGVEPIILKVDKDIILEDNSFYKIKIKGLETKNSNYINSLEYEVIELTKTSDNIDEHVNQVCEKN